ncbi:MAG: hypothetical protein R2932_20950 [Caldilineaceae bacterium]
MPSATAPLDAIAAVHTQLLACGRSLPRSRLWLGGWPRNHTNGCPTLSVGRQTLTPAGCVGGLAGAVGAAQAYAAALCLRADNILLTRRASGSATLTSVGAPWIGSALR